MIKSIEKIVLLLIVAFTFNGCATAPDMNRNALRVGVNPENPPMVFELNGNITGAEADLALRLGAALNRPIQFVNLSWENLIPALMEKKIDIIMSGMTITEARKTLINFTDYYLKSGLAILMRAEDAHRLNSLENILGSDSTVGAIVGTTSETFVRKNFSNALVVIPFQNTSDVVYSLKTRRIDLFVYDAPFIVWLASENEGSLTGFLQPLNVEHLGWGVRRGDEEFLKQVNSVLRNWKRDGTLKQVLRRWLPKWKNLD